MGKKRTVTPIMPPRLKEEIKDEIGDNDVLVARDRLKGALKELLRHSDTGSSADSSEENATQDYRQIRKFNNSSMMPTRTLRFPPPKKIRRRRQAPVDTAFHHTYVMKLFDRSVDLAQFREDTPLYPICRAWMANQPRNPNLIPKIRSPSPEPVNDVTINSTIYDSDGEIRDVFRLPLPLPRKEAWPRNRVPTPIESSTEELNLDYDGQTLKSRETLMREHVARWVTVRKKWHRRAHKNEERFEVSANVLGAIFRRAQTEFE